MAAKGFQTLLDTNTALKEQLAALKDINGTKAEGLRTDIAANTTPRLARQDAMLDKSPGQVHTRFARTSSTATSATNSTSG